jgi:hypothetical protein
METNYGRGKNPGRFYCPDAGGFAFGLVGFLI